MPAFTFPGPVSYTHLDVYKRQIQGSRIELNHDAGRFDELEAWLIAISVDSNDKRHLTRWRSSFGQLCAAPFRYWRLPQDVYKRQLLQS